MRALVGVALAAGLVGAGCAVGVEEAGNPLATPVLLGSRPAVCVPGTVLRLAATELPRPTEATLSVHLRGELVLDGSAGIAFDWVLPAALDPTDEKTVLATLDAAQLSTVWPTSANDGVLTASASLIAEEIAGWHLARSQPLDLTCAIRHSLTPTLTSYDPGPYGVNGAITLGGDGFLIAPSEGHTRVVLDGCFLPDGAAGECRDVGRTLADVELDALPARDDRHAVSFVWTPALTGLGPGLFRGNVRLHNDLASGLVEESLRYAVEIPIVRSHVDGILQHGVSLGQYVDVVGAGFVGATADEVSILRLRGSFLPTGASAAVAVDLQLIPHFVDGTRLRYVLDEADALGQRIDLRHTTGRFSGTLGVVVHDAVESIEGDTADIVLDLLPVRQVVYVRYLDSYRASLAAFGLTAADGPIRDRVLVVARRDYAGLNVDFRTTVPNDVALFSEVDIAGPDPNGAGFFGFDNTPGKDVGNQRLYDRIGGLDATTQSDGTPGYGGVFTEQFLGFSSRPGPAVPISGSDALFDALFDPLRPDSGRPVSAGELALVDWSRGGDDCPAPKQARADQIRCAVYALGNLIGTTLTHELGHSLGLADPDGDAFHDPGDAPARLMDSGAARPFAERAEVGMPAARFCVTEMAYLRAILPLPAPIAATSDDGDRPPCN